ncbi:hypothetical protein JX265_006736 [Neoarthrinium moseri]|uniref:Cytochrome P450 n=1 Tax=Neoarthrinium moseri TaxID=1658444 RepID=A0A9P9WKQ2_9PEZI|nr:hypothetical protein JX265_006736 [Neoarthrinium moseri]
MVALNAAPRWPSAEVSNIEWISLLVATVCPSPTPVPIDVKSSSGDVVRIAPNELVFLTPQAARGTIPAQVQRTASAFAGWLTVSLCSDIYLPHERMMESFVKTDFEDLGEGDGGISFETDPVKHREVAKRMAPAFSMKNFKAKEPTLQYYIDLFVDKMKEVGGLEQGAEMRRWADWLSMDIAADMTYNRQMNEMKDSEMPLLLNSV